MSPHSPPSALVVEPDASRRLRTVAALTSAGFQVIAAAAFDVARRSIVEHPPAVLVTALKLGEYNGLHLVLRARAAAPRTATLVTTDETGGLFRKDAQQAGATFVQDPVTTTQLLAAVFRTMFRTDDSVVVEPPFERRKVERRNALLPHAPDRRLHDRRRNVETLLQAASSG